MGEASEVERMQNAAIRKAADIIKLLSTFVGRSNPDHFATMWEVHQELDSIKKVIA